MSRQVFLTSSSASPGGRPRAHEGGGRPGGGRGRSRRGDATPGTGTANHPHESPWTMTTPLVVLAPVDRRRASSTCRSSSGSAPRALAGAGPRAGRGPHRRCRHQRRSCSRHRRHRRALLGIAAAVHFYLRRRLRERPVEPGAPRSWYLDSAIARVRRRSRRVAFEAVAWFDAHVIDGRSTASPRCAGRRHRGSPPPDRLRAHLRARCRPRGDRAGRGHHRPEQRPVMLAASADFPLLTATVVLPAIGSGHRPRVASTSSRPGSWRRSSRRHRRPDGGDPRRVRAGRRRLPDGREDHLDQGPRHLWRPRGRRHLAVPRRPDRRAVPDRDPRRTRDHDEKPFLAWLLLLEAGCIGVAIRN